MKRNVLLVLAAVAVLAIGSAAIASNMGFKINITLVAGAKSNWVSIPYYNSYPTALAAFNDITNCLEVTHWRPGTDNTESVTSPDDTDFNLVKGESFLVKVSGTGTVNWVVVGSHDPGYGMPLKGGAKSNWISVPYHTTSKTAIALLNEIPNCLEVTKWNPSTDNTQSVSSPDDTDFDITPGQGYLVKISGADENWTPAHY